MSWLFDGIKSWVSRMLSWALGGGGRSLGDGGKQVVIKGGGSSVLQGVDPAWDLNKLKQEVAPKLGLRPREVAFVLAGKRLSDSTRIEECDLGNQSILHAVKITNNETSPLDDIVEEGSKPLSETLLDLQLDTDERRNVSDLDKSRAKAHFFVSCNTCKSVQAGKLRVRCDRCKGGAFTVHADPQSWRDVLEHNRITGECLHEPSCSLIHHDEGPTYAEFYFKCAHHPSLGENDKAIPLYLIKSNIKDIPCLSCSDVDETVLVFPCNCGHVTCLDCFRHYCTSKYRY